MKNAKEQSSLYLADNPPTVVRLEIKPHFDVLPDQQKRYAHHLSRAAFLGTRITLQQVSPESEPIYDLIISLYHACRGDWKALAEKTGATQEDVTSWLQYAAQFLGNCGNYKGFGDSKFVPRIDAASLKKLASVSEECTKALEKAEAAGGGIYETKEPGLMHLGYPEKGHMTTYYPDSPDITKEEITLIGNLLEEKKLPLENTRLRKTRSGNFEVLIASGIANPSPKDRDLGDVDYFKLEGKLAGKTVKLVYGDYMDEMAKIAVEIKKAAKYALNDTQKHMLDEYAKSFATGSIEAYKESQRYWIKDKGPTVETDLGFIETYRDPHGIRGEWEGFVAMVNQERTRAFGKLVEAAPDIIPTLPWSKDFEKDKFLSPDFTSLEVLTFAGSGIPAGINIPNYDDIRQNLGFKNVSLGNVLNAKSPEEPVPFIGKEDEKLYREYCDMAFEVQVATHELFGHGVGKLLQETSAGTFNFDPAHLPISPLTHSPITTYYRPGQTYSSVFGPMASSYEECRAECVAMVLCCDPGVLAVFGLVGAAADHVTYTAYLQMARAGVAALEYWDPRSGKWGQIHMQARYAILRVLLAAGDGLVRLQHSRADLADLEVVLDRTKILSHGRPAVLRFLQKLHVYKCTADMENATALYEAGVSAVDDWWGQCVRRVVMEKKGRRKVFVQANTAEGEGGIQLREYEATVEGMVRSYAERGL